MNRRVINPWKWQDAFGFVQAIEVTGAGLQTLTNTTYRASRRARAPRWS